MRKTANVPGSDEAAELENFKKVLESIGLSNLKIKIGKVLFPLYQNSLENPNSNVEKTHSNVIDLTGNQKKFDFLLDYLNTKKLNVVDIGKFVMAISHGSNSEIAFSCRLFKLHNYLKTESYQELLCNALKNSQDSLLYTLASFFVANYPEEIENKQIQSMISNDFRFTKVIFKRFQDVVEGGNFFFYFGSSR